ncbi:MAG: ferritin family protein [Bacteroidota bacterium]
MERTEEITSLEVLGIAIRGLIDDQEIYQNLADKAENEILKNRIMNLYHEEKKQQKLLEKKYKEMFPNVELIVPPRDHDKKILLDRNLSIKGILQHVIQGHKESREYYLDLAEAITDLSGKRCFRFIADMKFSHQMMLTAELEMIEKYPAYFKSSEVWDAEHRLRADRIKRREN